MKYVDHFQIPGRAALLASFLVCACSSATPSAYTPTHSKRITWFVDEDGKVGLRQGATPLPVKFDGLGRARLSPGGLLLAMKCDDEAMALAFEALRLFGEDEELLDPTADEVETPYSADFTALRAFISEAVNRHNEAKSCVGERT